MIISAPAATALIAAATIQSERYAGHCWTGSRIQAAWNPAVISASTPENATGIAR